MSDVRQLAADEGGQPTSDTGGLADPVANAVMVVERAHLVAVVVRVGAGGAGNEKGHGDGGGKNGLHVVLLKESPCSPGPDSYSAVSLTIT